MTFGKIGLAALALSACVGLGGTASQAAPFPPGSAVVKETGIVRIQYRDHGRRFGPPRRVCKTEIVRRWVRGRLVTEHVKRCRTIR